MNEFPFAKRTEWPLTANKITQTLDSFKKQNIPVLDLTVSNPAACGIALPEKEILEALQSKENLTYQPAAQGLQEAREAISDYYAAHHKVDPENIFLTSSTSEGYAFLFRLLANYGEHILFPQPSYPLFSFLGDLSDIVIDNYSLIKDKDWAPDWEGLPQKIDAFTKAVVVVNPNNPTGSYLHAKEQEKLNKVCSYYRLAVISDEVFWDYPLERDKDAVSMVANKGALTFTLGGLSKALGLPQMKLSWIVVSGPDQLVSEAKKRLEVIADTFLSVNTPVQNALRSWFTHKDAIQGQIRQRITNNYEFLKKEVAGLKGVQLLKAQGGWYAILQLVNSGKNEEEWVLKLLSKYHLFVHPGYFFDFEEEPYLVVSLLTDPPIFKEGIERLLSRIEQEVS
ncbi:MAG TPA: pyridoxal phosphate-dependent aminotransferase [Candidatus Omnitrophota bacterium]|nr:pyridoxal phosphate-dependent aminotransferase [Candidatus Omnitrophota bacterium]